MTGLTLAGAPIHDGLEAILFDKDGTLFDIHAYWCAIVRMRAELAVAEWFAPLPAARRAAIETAVAERLGATAAGRIRPEGPVGARPRREVAEAMAGALVELGARVTAAEVETRVFQPVDARSEESLGELSVLLPGVRTLLSACRLRNVRAAIITNDVTRRAEGMLRAHRIDHLFDTVIGSDRVSRAKPAAEPALAALAALGCAAEAAAAIGDHPGDVEMALAAGIGCRVAVLTGTHGREAFSGLRCHLAATLDAVGLA